MPGPSGEGAARKPETHFRTLALSHPLSDPFGRAPDDGSVFSPHIEFSRAEWARLRGSTPLTLSQGDLQALHSTDEHVSMDEVMEVFRTFVAALGLLTLTSGYAAIALLTRVTPALFPGYEGEGTGTP